MQASPEEGLGRSISKCLFTNNSQTGNSQNNGKKELDLETFIPCFIDAMINAAIGLVPGGGVAQAALNYMGVSVNLAQWLMGQSNFFTPQADIIDTTKAATSIGKDIAISAYAIKGGDVELKQC